MDKSSLAIDLHELAILYIGASSVSVVLHAWSWVLARVAIDEPGVLSLSLNSLKFSATALSSNFSAETPAADRRISRVSEMTELLNWTNCTTLPARPSADNGSGTIVNVEITL